MSALLFSDRWRILNIFLTLAIIISLSLYAFEEGPKNTISFRDMQSSPKQYRDHPFAASYYIILDIKTNLFTAFSSGLKDTITVIGDLSTLEMKIGDRISFKGTYNVKGFIELREARVHSKRPLKVYFSIPPLLFVIGFFIKTYKINSKTLQFERRN